MIPAIAPPERPPEDGTGGGVGAGAGVAGAGVAVHVPGQKRQLSEVQGVPTVYNQAGRSDRQVARGLGREGVDARLDPGEAEGAVGCGQRGGEPQLNGHPVVAGGARYLDSPANSGGGPSLGAASGT